MGWILADLNGLSAVLADAVRDAPAPPVAQPVQLGLLDQLPDDDHASEAASEKRQGRPPGSRNRRTEDWAAYLSLRYGHPLERLAQLAAADPRQLASQLGMKTGDLLGRQIEALKALVPYVASPMPQKVQVTGKGALLIGIAPAGGMASGDHLVTDDPLAALDRFLDNKLEQLQRVSDADDEARNASDGNDRGESRDKSEA